MVKLSVLLTACFLMASCDPGEPVMANCFSRNYVFFKNEINIEEFKQKMLNVINGYDFVLKQADFGYPDTKAYFPYYSSKGYIYIGLISLTSKSFVVQMTLDTRKTSEIENSNVEAFCKLIADKTDKEFADFKRVKNALGKWSDGKG
jgi:hypothetical protein